MTFDTLLSGLAALWWLSLAGTTAVLGYALDPSLVVSALEGALAASFYAGAWYMKAEAEGEAFDLHKFGSTVLVGTGVGLSLGVVGSSVTAPSIEARLVLLVGVISLVEAVLKTASAYRRGGAEAARREAAEQADDLDDAFDELEQAFGPDDDEDDDEFESDGHETIRTDGGRDGFPTGVAGDLPDTVPFYTVQGETDYEFAYYCGTCAEQGEHPVVSVEDASRHRRSHDGERMRIRRVEFGTPGEALGIGEPATVPRSPTRADGGRSFSTNPEVCPECSLTLKNGVCRTAGCDGPSDGGESA